MFSRCRSGNGQNLSQNQMEMEFILSPVEGLDAIRNIRRRMANSFAHAVFY
jgi:hypothetical protein